jgi:hypothetical protein
VRVVAGKHGPNVIIGVQTSVIMRRIRASVASILDRAPLGRVRCPGSGSRSGPSSTHRTCAAAHRRRVPDRVVFDHVLAALVHGSGYERIALRGCSDRTVRRRLHEWAQAGHGAASPWICPAAYDHMIGLDLADLAVDGAIHQGPVRGGGRRAQPGGPGHVKRIPDAHPIRVMPEASAGGSLNLHPTVRRTRCPRQSAAGTRPLPSRTT